MVSEELNLRGVHRLLFTQHEIALTSGGEIVIFYNVHWEPVKEWNWANGTGKGMKHHLLTLSKRKKGALLLQQTGSTHQEDSLVCLHRPSLLLYKCHMLLLLQELISREGDRNERRKDNSWIRKDSSESI